jgi:hypothetical protein
MAFSCISNRGGRIHGYVEVLEILAGFDVRENLLNFQEQIA